MSVALGLGHGCIAVDVDLFLADGFVDLLLFGDGVLVEADAFYRDGFFGGDDPLFGEGDFVFFFAEGWAVEGVGRFLF